LVIAGSPRNSFGASLRPVCRQAGKILFSRGRALERVSWRNPGILTKLRILENIGGESELGR